MKVTPFSLIFKELSNDTKHIVVWINVRWLFCTKFHFFPNAEFFCNFRNCGIYTQMRNCSAENGTFGNTARWTSRRPPKWWTTFRQYHSRGTSDTKFWFVAAQPKIVSYVLWSPNRSPHLEIHSFAFRVLTSSMMVIIITETDKTFFVCKYILVIQRNSLVADDIFNMLEHGSFTGSWNVHWSVHVLDTNLSDKGCR